MNVPARSAASEDSVRWIGDETGLLEMIDQTLLPGSTTLIRCERVEEVWEAIRALRVRGAPAIGIAAAYGVCVAIRGEGSLADLLQRAVSAADYLATSRPTAVNLFWALDRMRSRIAEGSFADAPALRRALLDEARAIHDEDRQMCRAIGRHGAELFEDGFGVLTHCNAGGLATAEYGTALSAIFTAHDQGKRIHVWVDETRPLLQGARLTAWELMRHQVPCTLICDSMAAQVMREGRIQAVIVGADRITANGDVANKIGTYSVAVLAHHHGIPFYVAAPSSTFDLTLVSGEGIPIEQRAASEITEGFGRRTAPEGVAVYNPAFDVVPARLVTAIVTERGVIAPVSARRIASVIGDAIEIA
ncbi:MAG TPA: S-methyl-5-thioribose-1-phosphate isomerase [Planctomycetaceae bacterium]|nr:S-methyl-5-thioribose-1-phosphate isomerase [Planctomycetaceae bacterium]HRF02493.1 S-methyl-5-thioribose-1-phosphate isomerase [Pirellulaceae bacterium]